jgi:molybdate transport system ATP-binding protein
MTPFRWRAARHKGTLVHLDQAGFRRGESRVFSGTNWEIQSGQCWGVVGDFDSGRNTLIHALCGDIPPVEGEVDYGYETIDPQFEGCPESGIVHVLFEDQQHALANQEAFAQIRWNPGLDHEGHTAADFLSLEKVDQIYSMEDVAPQRLRRYRAIRKEVIRSLYIAPLLERTLDQVSNGERRKLFLARALLADPMLIILEHPFEGLDPTYRSKLQKIFSTLLKDGMNLMFLAPDTEALPKHVTHLAQVKNHRLKVVGPFKPKPSSPRKPGPSMRVRMPTEWKKRLRKHDLHAPVARLEQVRVAYDDKVILDGVDWTIQPGERWALSGPNGAGKSTLLSLLQGDNPQAYGNAIEMFGKPYGVGHSIWEVKKRIGSVSPEAHLYFPSDLSALEVVCTGFFDTLRLFDACGKVRQHIAREWLECLELGDQADTTFGDLPVEEQRLTLIARAIVKQVDLLILDEPCMGLDTRHRERLLALVEGIVKASGCALIYVTHQRENLPACITHRIRLKGGRVVRKERTS